jgi:hypothetical protein
MNGQQPAIDLPLALWLGAAFVSFLTSIVIWFFVDKTTGIFVGIWVPSILALAAALRAGR